MREDNRAPIVLLDLRARGLDQLAVLYPGRARGLAGAAIETPVDVLHESIAQCQASLVDEQHLANASAPVNPRTPSPQSRYVGQLFRHRPQCIQRA